jgi:hypothetical protein
MTAATREVIQRIEAEYREMSGLMLTAAGAAALALDNPTCATALGTLLQPGFLKQRPTARTFNSGPSDTAAHPLNGPHSIFGAERHQVCRFARCSRPPCIVGVGTHG